MMLIHIFCTLFFLCRYVYSLTDVLDIHADNNLLTPDLAAKYGYPLEIHKVMTDDGYILQLHRIPYGRRQYGRAKNNAKTPILLQHGLAGSSADWILMGPNHALGYMLADEGYDVWLGNNRGNIYSRQHRHIHPSNSTFWDFSYHELGIYDLPAVIDYILDATSRSKIIYIAHSQGGTQFFVMAALRPEYNAKVKLAIGLAPAAFTGNLRGPLTQLTKLTYFGVWVGEQFGYPEFGSRSTWSRVVSSVFCGHGNRSINYPVICGNSIFLVTGFTPEEFYGANFSIISSHVPAGASWKQVVHFGQGHINPGHFRQFDYGENSEKNLRCYNSYTPPEYPLFRVTAPVALFTSDDDWLVTPEDIQLLRSKLPNVVMHHNIRTSPFSHYAFLWGKKARKLIHDPILQLLTKYR